MTPRRPRWLTDYRTANIAYHRALVQLQHAAMALARAEQAVGPAESVGLATLRDLRRLGR